MIDGYADVVAGRQYGLELGKWGNMPTNEFFLALPILRTFDTVWTVDTPDCVAPFNLDLMSRFGDTVTLRWDHDGSHSEWQLSYGPTGFDPDSGTFVTCNINRWRFKDTVNVPMQACVRTVCRELDTLRYSDWCDPAEWYVTPSSIAPPEEGRDLAGLVTVAPNPASGLVTLSSVCPMTAVEVYSASGTLVKSSTAKTRAVTFPVADWPRGVYFARVHTAFGVTTKRIVVQD